MEATYNMKQAADQIKRLVASKAAPANSEIDMSAMLPRKKKASTGVLSNHNHRGNNPSKNNGAHSYCLLCKKNWMTASKWKLHSSKNCFENFPTRHLSKKGLGGTLGNWAAAVKQYHKSENKCKREVKPIKKYNKMIFSMAKWSGSCHELKKIKKIHAKASNKYD